MKKNPLFLLLGLSAVFFGLFVLFVFFAMGNFVKDGAHSGLLSKSGTNIGVIPLTGVIMDSRKFMKQMQNFEEDNSIKGIIVRINSPGGAVAPSQEIHDTILRVRKTKPVIASFESVAASGGYYAAVAAEKIVTNPGSMTGSIGVIMDFANLGELYKWAKVERFNIKSGKFKDIGNENRPMTVEEKALLQGMVNNVYEQFVQAVAKGRKMTPEKVREVADGRILSGDQAVKLGLADTLGGLDVAQDVIKELAFIKGKVNLVYPDPKKRSLLEVLTQGTAEGLARGFVQSLVPALHSALDQESHSEKGLYFF